MTTEAEPAESAPRSPRKSSTRKTGYSGPKLNVKKAAKRAKKEVIDYSAKQSPGCGDQDKMLGQSPLALTPSDDPMGKVHNWLLQQRQGDGVGASAQSSAPAAVPAVAAGPAVGAGAAVPKSKSSPAGLSPDAGAGAHRRSLVQPTGQLDADKVRLQVLYKTPFKFRLKLKGSGASGVTTKLSADRVRKYPSASAPSPGAGSPPALEEQQKASRKVVGGIAGPRTAMLVRTREPSSQHRKSHRGRKDLSEALPAPPGPECPPTPPRDADIDSNIHTVPSDLEGLLAEVGASAGKAGPTKRS